MIRLTKRYVVCLLAAALMSSVQAETALAENGVQEEQEQQEKQEQEKEKIGKVYLTVDADLGLSDGSHVEVTPEEGNAERYHVEGVEILGDGDTDYSNSNPPEIEITLASEDQDAWYFASSSSSSVHLSLSAQSKSRYEKIKLVSVRRKDDNATLVIRAKLLFDKEADVSPLSPPSSASWDSSLNGQASWNSVSGAKYYQVQLLKDRVEIGRFRSVYATTYDFSSQMTEPGVYHFQVRAVKISNNTKSAWTDSTGTLTVGADGAITPVAQWKLEGTAWYFYDSQGKKATGWIELGGAYYYLDPSTGAMYANCRTPDGYWVDENGRRGE